MNTHGYLSEVRHDKIVIKKNNMTEHKILLALDREDDLRCPVLSSENTRGIDISQWFIMWKNRRCLAIVATNRG